MGGNACRRLLHDKQTREAYLELIPENHREMFRVLVSRVSIGLRVASSKSELGEEDVARLEEYNRATYRYILEKYPPPLCQISPSVHKLLAHSWELISNNENFGLGTIAEGGLEACNKLLRRYRTRLSKKCNQQDNLADCGKRLWVNADPLLEKMRQSLLPVCSNCQTRGHGKRHCPSRVSSAAGEEDTLVGGFFK